MHPGFLLIMELVFLGTSSMVPTKTRNHSSALLLYKDEGIMVDCGEGTQRQLKLAGIRPTKITKLLISHWHGDHVFGLPGLLQTLGADEYNKTLELYGPKGSKAMLEGILKAFIMEAKIKYRVTEVEEGVFFKNKHFELSSLPLSHTSPCVGFRFQELDRRKINMGKLNAKGIKEGPLVGKLQQGEAIEFNGKIIRPEEVSSEQKGRSIAFITDTRLVDNCYKLADRASMLVCEATFADELQQKAGRYKHLTAAQAAQIAKKANADKLVLTHFSQRYKSTSELERSAKQVFKRSVAAKDLMRISL
jgi:ribonuclease Z